MNRNRVQVACLSSVLLAAALLAPSLPVLAQGRTGFTGLGTLGGTFSEGFGINASGQMVGSSYLPGDTDYHAFLYSGGSMRDLGTLDGTYSVGLRINASGQVTGYSKISGDTAYHAMSATYLPPLMVLEERAGRPAN